MNKGSVKPPGLILLSLLLFFLMNAVLYGQIAPVAEGPSVLYPEPQPFSLDSISAIDCIALLKRVGFIELKDKEGGSSVVRVRTVWSYFLALDESYPPGHRLRYDIILNEEPLDWERSFIEYGGDMLSLRLLFLYRNQHPALDYKYRRGTPCR